MKIFNTSDNKFSSCTKCSKVCCVLSTIVISTIVAIVVNKIMFNKTVESAIKNNPKAIIDAVEKYYKDEQYRAKENASKKAPEIAKKLEKTNPLIGNPKGSKVIVEFFDYVCGHCKRQAVELGKVIKEDSDVKVVLADLAIMSQYSLTSAQVGIYISLKNPDKLERYYHELSKLEINSPSVVKKVLNKLGLPENYIDLASKDKQVEQILQGNFQAAREVGLQGTPALIINGKLIGGMVTANDITAMLK